MAIEQHEIGFELFRSGDFEIEVSNTTGIVGAYMLTVSVTR